MAGERGGWRANVLTPNPESQVDDTPSDPGPPQSFAESLATLQATSAADNAGDQRDLWWRHRWQRAAEVTDDEIHAAAQRHLTTGARILEYLRHMASFSNRRGDQLIHARLATLADRMRCSTDVVTRCRAAATELGLHERLGQTVWVGEARSTRPPSPTAPDGTISAWYGGPAVYRLTMPASTVPRRRRESRSDAEAERVHARRFRRYQLALERKAEMERSHQAWMDRIVEAAPRAPERPDVAPRSAQVQAALEAARLALAGAPRRT